MKLFAQGCANPVACENQLPGNTGWDVDGAGDSTIQGYATDISARVGDTVSFKVNTNAKNYTIGIYRIGYYGGAGARLITTISPSVSLPQTQPPCLTNSTTNLIDCGNWNVSATWQVPSYAVSGLYLALLTRTDTGGSSQMFFVVRDDTSHSDILYMTSDETWQAYNDYGGHSLYGGAGTWDLNNRAYKVSYNRPFDTRAFEAATFLFSGEYPMIRFLEANGYDVSYFTDVDAARNGGVITNHKLLLSVGHDEYVSGQRRASEEAARAAGVNIAFFSGNEDFWKTRWENSTDGSNTPYRTLACYKETYYGTGQATYLHDPSDPPSWTGTWRDPRFSPPGDGGRPENALTGTLFMVNGPGADNEELSIQVPAADGKMRFWRNTSIASLSPGQSASLPAGTLGYEWDGDIDNGARPAGLFPLSTSTYNLTTDLLLDYGATYGAGPMTHHLTLYRAPSGALVFGGGTVQWAWGLDGNHDGGQTTPDPRMQQATVNLFADMGVQPTTLLSGLVPATQSTDATPPTVTITSPASGSSVPYGTALTISGTAADAGGGVVGAVEVSTDGGQSWHPATGREQWSYTWNSPYTQGSSATVMARAVDDSGNLEQTPATVSFGVSGVPACPCSIWSSSSKPATASTNDANSAELGVKFRSDVAGSITGVRFYKGSANTGTHVGHLWTLQGALLASVTFTNETATGWQQANFSAPVSIAANTTYVVSYLAPNGEYADDEPYFLNAGVDASPLHALANNVAGGNGVYVYTTTGAFPTGTYAAGNYWVDVVFTANSPWSIAGTIAGTSGAAVTLSGAANATTTTDASGNYSFPNLANGSYTVTPSENGYSFSPASQNVTINGSSATGVNFSGSVIPTFTISGNAGAAGAQVALSGAATATVNADSSGNYSFSGVTNGAYVVTPSLTGYTFTPANQNVTVNGANVTGVNFSGSSLTTFTISGNITGASGVTVVLSGSNSASTTTDASGNYSFTTFNGSYTVTPTKTGYSMTPASQNVTVNGSNVSGVNFSASQASSIWNNSATPGTASVNDYSAVELGMKFRSDVPGFVTGVRFFKGANNTGTHIGNLWTSSGTNLASVTFTNETASGWQQATFATPVAIAANTTYIVSYYAPLGQYAADGNYFASNGVDSPPLHALQNGVDGPNGVYLYATGGGFPNQSFSATNYWVDLVFTTGWTISGTITGGPGATVALTGTASGTTTADASGNYSFTNLASGAYTVTPSKSGLIFTPASQNATVNNDNVTGLNFTGSAPTYALSGTISGGAGATVTLSGAGSGSATADGTGSYSFTGLANGTYTVTPSKSGYAMTPASQNVTVNGANVTGVNFTASSLTTYTISGNVTGASGVTVTLSGSNSATTSTDASGNYSFTTYNGSYTVTPSATGFGFTPANQSVTVNGANVSGINFAAGQANSIWSSSATPVTVSVNDYSPVEIGVKFRSDVPGLVTAVRFYKGVSNTGTHIGNLWTSSGTNLGTVTFASETASGWQQATFSTPIAIAANTTYVVSYYAPNGNYAADGTFFANNGVDSPPLHALQNGVDGPNGVYLYASGGGFPNQSYNATNYWVDLVFSPGAAYSISGTITGGAGATVALSGAATASTTADGSGNFTFTGLGNGAYTLTPSKSGYSFTPASRNVTVNGANVTGVSFTATAATYSVSGTITGGAGATVALSGAATASTTADGSGNFSFANLANGAYTVTPSKSGYTMAPASQNVTVNGANVTGVSFTASAATYSISGTITGGAGATVALSGAATASTTADGSGTFSFTGLGNGAYTVTPSKSGYTIAPASQNVTVNGANVTGVSFTATAATYSVSGTITGGAGATVALSGAATASTKADGSGNFSFTGLSNGGYTITPSKSGYSFTPASQNVTVNGANVTGVSFSAGLLAIYGLSGTITNGAGATVTLSGTASATTTANASGAFSFSNLANGSYTLTPSLAGFSFAPATQNVTINGASVSGIAFTGKGVSIDATTSKDQTSANTKVATAAFSTTSTNELLLAFVSADRTSLFSNTTVSSISGGGLTWTLVKRTNGQYGTAEIWRAFAKTILTNTSVTATLNQSAVSSMTVISFRGVDTTGTNGAGAIGATGGSSARSGAPSTSLVTTRINSWVVGVGQDYDAAIARTVGTNQKLTHQYAGSGKTFWVQMQNAPTPASGTTVTINDTAPTADRFNLTICAVQPGL